MGVRGEGEEWGWSGGLGVEWGWGRLLAVVVCRGVAVQCVVWVAVRGARCGGVAVRGGGGACLVRLAERGADSLHVQRLERSHLEEVDVEALRLVGLGLELDVEALRLG